MKPRGALRTAALDVANQENVPAEDPTHSSEDAVATVPPELCFL